MKNPNGTIFDRALAMNATDSLSQKGMLVSSSFGNILTWLTENAGMKAAVLVSPDGLPMASSPADYDADTAAAMVGLLQKANRESADRLRLGELDEIVIFDRQMMRFVLRYIFHDGEDFILAVSVPPDHSYRLVTNLALKQIKQLIP